MLVVLEVCAIGISDIHICGKVTMSLDELQRRRKQQLDRDYEEVAQDYSEELIAAWRAGHPDWKEAVLHLGHILEVII